MSGMDSPALPLYFDLLIVPDVNQICGQRQVPVYRLCFELASIPESVRACFCF